MQVHYDLNTLPQISNAIVTQGTFDGVHAAHQVILNRLKQLAHTHDGETVVITFDPHPRMVLYPDDHGLKLLHTLDEKIESLRKFNIRHLVVIPFTKQFSRYSSIDFIKNILVEKLHTHTLVIGYNHRFGRNREGTFEHLKEHATTYGFNIFEIPEQDIENESVSSTRIRKAIERGEVVLAAKYLGYPYMLSGQVVKGKQLGRTIGFPTANLVIANPHKLVPADGVYAVHVFINNQLYNGMLNCGYRPTVDGVSHAIEVHVINFEGDLYNINIKVAFVDNIRSELKFNSVVDLKNQLEKDKLQALKLLEKNK
jgi:riboflavin kinase/FMN adenylyltransferase